MVRRDRHDIVVDILRKAASGTRKTELMTNVGLSFVQTQQYLDMLVKKGLLHIDGKRFIKTTKKGMEFLEKCNECILFPWEKQSRE
ncbi:MAG: winged helix-turn-helix domain-containing protein [Candidatus Bathyarchaeia archaeon]